MGASLRLRHAEATLDRQRLWLLSQSPLSGRASVSYDGVAAGGTLAWDASADELRALLHSIAGVGRVSVERARAGVHGFVWEVGWRQCDQ